MLHTNNPLNIKLIKKCPVCTKEYNQAKIQILEESDYGLLTYATCSQCGSNLLTKFSSLPQGIVGNAILTDLKPQEVMDFAIGDELTADEALNVQEMIYKNELINSFKKII
jgi:hypothetical protein